MQLYTNQYAFFELLRAGLFPAHGEGVMVNDSLFEDVDWEKVYQIAQEQSVQGIVLQGIEELRAKNIELNVPKMLLLQWIGEVHVIEQRNKEMNTFIADLIEKLRKADIYVILVKGQGIAQCYEKPLWRSSGDVDLLLSDSNYDKAKNVLLPLATNVEQEFTHFKHLGMTINGWVVELHGTLHSRLSGRVDKGIDDVQKDIYYGGKVRSVEFKSSSGSWLTSPTFDATLQNSSVLGSVLTASTVQVFLPAPDEDVIFVFTHILHHFFFEGIGLRQICDWCRLLWAYKDSLNHGLLESRIQKMGLMTEWKAFAAFAVNWLGMPVEAMPFYSAGARWEHKADRISSFVLEVGNFGHNQRRDFSGMSYLKRKLISFWGRLNDMLRHFRLFPLDSIRFFGGVLRSGLHAVVHGE